MTEKTQTTIVTRDGLDAIASKLPASWLAEIEFQSWKDVA